MSINCQVTWVNGKAWITFKPLNDFYVYFILKYTYRPCLLMLLTTDVVVVTSVMWRQVLAAVPLNELKTQAVAHITADDLLQLAELTPAHSTHYLKNKSGRSKLLIIDIRPADELVATPCSLKVYHNPLLRLKETLKTCNLFGAAFPWIDFACESSRAPLITGTTKCYTCTRDYLKLESDGDTCR